MRTLDQYNFAGKKAVVRVDFNVPLDEELRITDYTRIHAATPTIKKILADGGSVVLLSHLGRPKGGPDKKNSLRNLVLALQHEYAQEVKFGGDVIGEEATAMAAALKPGEILLLDNLRFHPEEEKGDPTFAQKLARLGDMYVNNAFDDAHRRHDSTAVMAQYFAY